MCDAHDAEAIARLRARKHRPHKPFAVMFADPGAATREALARQVRIDDAQFALLRSDARPVVLLPRPPSCTLPDIIAPGLREIGVLLPYSPLHHLLLDAFGAPLVATSGNVSGEPVISDNAEARQRLASIADGFLHHARPIARPAAGGVYRHIAGRAGSAPRANPGAAPLRAVGTRPHRFHARAKTWMRCSMRGNTQSIARTRVRRAGCSTPRRACSVCSMMPATKDRRRCCWRRSQNKRRVRATTSAHYPLW